MTPLEILGVLLIVLCILFVFSAILIKWRHELHVNRDRQIHYRSQLAIQRIAYIRDLRFALKEAEKYIKFQTEPLTGSINAEALLTMVGKLTTAVDTNGQPLQKGNNELY